MKNCSIFEYQNIEITENLKSQISKILENLIKIQNFDIFFFGELGNFEKLCLETARSLKTNYPYIKLVYVLSTYSNLSKKTIEFYKKDFDECIYISPRSEYAKQTRLSRDFAMIENSDFCIFKLPKDIQSHLDFSALTYATHLEKDLTILK